MKKIIMYGIILSLLLPVITEAERKYDESELLWNFMDALGGECLESDYVFNGLILKEFVGEKEINLLGEEIKSKLNLMGEEIDPLIFYENLPEKHYTKEVIFDEGFSQIIYSGYDERNNSIAIILSSYLREENSQGETYLCINIIKNSDFLKNNDIIETVELLFKAYNSSVDTFICLVGEFQGDYEHKSMEKKVKKTLKKYKGNVIEEYCDISLISFIIYTPLIKEYLLIDRNKINLNLAIRYNEYEDKTCILLATPIITNGY